MLKAILARGIDRFEKTWGYDASYMRALLAASPASFFRFGFVTQLADRRAAPAGALAAAGIVGTLSEDCGPCVQISADMAAAGGVKPEVIRAILAGDETGMGADAALVWRFARAARAKAHVREGRPRYSVDRDAAERLASAFLQAAGSGDVGALSTLLAEDALLVSDGGGKRPAALRVLVGRADIVRFYQGLAWRHALTEPDGPLTAASVRFARINGLPGVVLELEDGPQTIALEPDSDGRIAAIYTVRNPDKLGHVQQS